MLQGLVKYNPWSLSGMSPVLVIKFYWDPAMLTRLCAVYDCFCAETAELSRHEGDRWPARSETLFILWTFIDEVY